MLDEEGLSGADERHSRFVRCRAYTSQSISGIHDALHVLHILPGAAEKNGAEGSVRRLNELKIFTETVAVDGGKMSESGETNMVLRVRCDESEDVHPQSYIRPQKFASELQRHSAAGLSTGCEYSTDCS